MLPTGNLFLAIDRTNEFANSSMAAMEPTSLAACLVHLKVTLFYKNFFCKNVEAAINQNSTNVLRTFRRLRVSRESIKNVILHKVR